MILQTLASYYDRLAQEANTNIAPEGFEKKAIPFLIVLNQQGGFVGLQDTRQGEGKKKSGRVFTVPKAVKRSSRIEANLLWDTPAYVLGRPKPDKRKVYEKLVERAKEQHSAFLIRIHETFPTVVDEGIRAVLRFLERGDFTPIFSHPLWPEIEESGANLTFQLEGDRELICQRPTVMSVLTMPNAAGKGDLRICLVTGGLDEPVRLHTAIKGVWGARSSGANIVSFNLDAFNSYGKTQGYNAPVGKKAEFAYTTALNTLLAKGSRQRIQVGDASTVFWSARANPMEDLFAGFFGEPAKGESSQDNESIRALYGAPQTGAPPLEEDLTPFYVLGLAPNASRNASRISVRFWYARTVGEVAKYIRQHFDDTAIVHGPNQLAHLPLFRLLVSTAIQGRSDNIQPNLAGEVMKAVLTGMPYSKTLLASAIRRVRAEHEITYPRAALIKAVLVRDARFYRKQDKEVDVSLDISNANPGYLLGRLFAVLERAQEAANPNINATIRDRFYGAASSTPVAVFPHLLKLKNYHIAKLENRGLAVNLEKQIGEIMGGFDDFPTHLSLADQGRFAIGYYHQRQAFFTKKEGKDI